MREEEQKSKDIITTLMKNGYEAYYVGGCVRDRILQRPVVDFDIVTSADTDTIINLFKSNYSVEEVGKTFGVILLDGIEVAQYRTEHYNVAGKPEVTIANTMVEDAGRRDFTVNGLYSSLEGTIFDLHDGIQDLKDKKIRAIGNPVERFTEDPSRILRGVYLASKLGFTIEPNTRQTMHDMAHLLESVPEELKGKIIKKSIASGTYTQFIREVMDIGLMPFVFPDLVHLVGLPQNPKYHDAPDAWQHVLRVIEHGESLRKGDIAFLLGMTFHDVAKGLEGIRGVNRKGYPNDLGHEKAGVPIAYNAIIKKGFGKDIAKEATFYVCEHGLRISAKSKERSKIKFLRGLKNYFKDKSEIRQYLPKLMDALESDASGFAASLQEQVDKDRVGLLESLNKTLETCLIFPKDLCVDGSLIQSYGYEGREVGDVISYLIQNNVTELSRVLKVLERDTAKVKKH